MLPTWTPPADNLYKFGVYSSTVSRLAPGIISFAPIAFVKGADWNGEEHGTAIRGSAGGDVGGCGSPPRDPGGDVNAVGGLRRAVRGGTRRARATTPCP